MDVTRQSWLRMDNVNTVNIPHCPDDWPYHQWYRLVRRGLPVDAEVAASQPDRRAWVRVYPLGESRYHVSYFEVPRDRYDEVYETMDFDQPGMLLNEQRLVVTGEAELAAALSQWLDDLSRLGEPGVGTSPV
jgi:hypothetical protein